MKDFKEFLKEEEIDKNYILEELNDLEEIASSVMEAELIDLIQGLVEHDVIKSDAYDGIYDILEEIYSEDGTKESDLEEAVPLYKKKGMVKCPDGRIRKRGQCSKPIDKKKSRILKKAAKSSKAKQSRKKAQIKIKRTKKRLGQQK